jgi:ATP-dependent Clp protease protease subunit
MERMLAQTAGSTLSSVASCSRGARALRAKAAVGKAARSSSKTETRMNMGFHQGFLPEQPKVTPGMGDLLTPDGQPLFGGLTEKQLDILGLTSKADEFKAMGNMPTVTAESITGKANYRREVPSMSALETKMSGGGVPAQAPPDLPSLLLNSRICYLGMPLVPAVTELLIAELLFLGYDSPEKPVYFYINSTGSQTQEGQAVGFETEAYAILDTMRYVRPEMHTVCVGKAWGNAAMLLASGKKGFRHSLPHASIMTQPPRLNRTQDCATNIVIKANEIDHNTQTYVEFLSEFTGKDKEEVYKDVGRTKWFTPKDAIDYGLIDKVVDKGLQMDNKDYEMMLATAQSRAAGGRMPSGAGQ